jgi:(1->4)-alpha-D-glucan 1-alpha-D-glucosylmutase
MNTAENVADADFAAGIDAFVASLDPLIAPLSTYRVQLHAGFTFDDAAAIVPYLSDLGVDTLYASPHFQAAPGSQHGYDVTDPTRLNEELGGEEGYGRLHAALKRHGLKLMADIVPNHMGIANGANRFWQDVLENGRTSPFVTWFDIDWQPIKSDLNGQVLLPVLGEQYGVVLEQGELTLSFADGAFVIHYYALPLPIAPPTYGFILQRALPAIESAFEQSDLARLEFESILAAYDRLPPNDTTDDALIQERQREQIVTRGRLSALFESEPRILTAILDAVASLNGNPADPASFDALDELLNMQSYRLAFWRVAAEEINYRRFFAINELAALRQEVPAVFEESHALVSRLIAESKIHALRIDHPDGLWDPAGYVADLQRLAFLARCRRAMPSDSEWEAHRPLLERWWNERRAAGENEVGRELFPVVVEKILEPGESLPDAWPVSGTVGYEFARIVTGLFVDRASEKAFNQWYERFAGEREPFATQVYEAKRLILRVALSSELNVLAAALDRLSERRRRTRDFTLNALRFALREVISAFPIYRTYIAEDGTPTADDRRTIDRAVALARRRNPASDPRVFGFLRDMLLGLDDPMDAGDEADRIRFVMRFQQLTGPVMAKGLEDTVFYRYVRLAALNEVGGDPAHFGASIEEFHRHNRDQLAQWPDALLSSSTHDTKRSEDVRARIVTISEFPREWRAAVNRWSRLNARHRTREAGESAPTRNDEALFYQTLAGTWPFGADRPDQDYVERMVAYMLKAAREAQEQTSWVNPNESYEAALDRFVRCALDSGVAAPFLNDFAAHNREIERAGAFTALSMQVLKLTSPGVPDLYQGTERWDFSLVDPDNRRPVDYDALRAMLDELAHQDDGMALAERLIDRIEDGGIKLYTSNVLLHLRRSHPDLVRRGNYVPVDVEGEWRDYAIAFARHHEGKTLIVVVPRLLRSLVRRGGGVPIGEPVWGDTRIVLPELASASLANVMTGESLEVDAAGLVPVAALLNSFPVACLLATTLDTGVSA